MNLKKTSPPMNYSETLNYIYNRLPLFQIVGSSAYKEGLESMIALDNYLGNPHLSFSTVHVGGTNGKGSVSHTIASVLQAAGYKTGLFTSPHLIDFRERIRINGIPVPEDFVVDFVEKYKHLFDIYYPSFFEVNVAMAFQYFKQEAVDMAVIEVGLGGRLDSTNIISPRLSVITNISLDHTDILGNSLVSIANEKAGIIKPETPVVIGEAEDEVRRIFEMKALENNAPIFFAQETDSQFTGIEQHGNRRVQTFCIEGERIETPLLGIYQRTNMPTAWKALQILRDEGVLLSPEAVRTGFLNVIDSTGLQGRWQILQEKPLVICDTGHNEAGISYISQQLKETPHKQLRMVIGFVKEKDVDKILKILPQDAVYYFTKAGISRALPETELMSKALKSGLSGRSFPSVKEAFEAALNDSDPDDLVFVGGSTYVVAEVLKKS